MPLAKPKDGESKDDFLSRCMGDDKMNSEYPNKKQRAAVCNAQYTADFKEHDEDDKKSKKVKGYTVEAEIFAVGLWNGMEFSAEDLMDFASNFHQLREYHKVPLKMGHNDDQPFTDGQPALGWVDDVWYNKQSKKLMAKFVEVPEIVKTAIEHGRYKHVSIEADFGVEHGSKFYSNVLSGVALLGADIPAVNTLKDLQTYMSKDGESLKINFSKRQCFSYREGDSKMNEVEKLQKELADEQARSAKFSKDAADAKAELEKIREENAKAEFARKKQDFTAELEELVKAKKLTPAQRDDMLKDYSEENAASMHYSLDVIKKHAGTVIDDGEKGAGGGDHVEEDGNPTEEVDKRATKYSREHKVSYNDAVQQVLSEDNELAKRYIEFNEA